MRYPLSSMCGEESRHDGNVIAIEVETPRNIRKHLENLKQRGFCKVILNFQGRNIGSTNDLRNYADIWQGSNRWLALCELSLTQQRVVEECKLTDLLNVYDTVSEALMTLRAAQRVRETSHLRLVTSNAS